MSSFKTLRTARDARQAGHRQGVGTLSSGPETVDTAGSSDAGASASVASSRTTDSTPSPDASLFASSLAGTPLEVRSTPTHGRGLYATRSISAGSVLLRTEPVVSVLTRASCPTHCWNCFKSSTSTPSGKLLRCAACKAGHYCSVSCQRADWPAHKPECAAHKRLRGMWARTYPERASDGTDFSWIRTDPVRALGRLCWGRRAGRASGNGRDPEWWTQTAAMESHVKQLPEKDVMKLAHEVQHLQAYISAAEPSPTPDVLHPADMATFGFTSGADLLNMCSAFLVNSFTLSTADLTPIGVATSPVCALFNHSCAPNAVVVFPNGGKDMHVVAIADIAPGDEVLTSYIDVSLPVAERQADLRDRYGFDCDCTLCARSTDMAWVDPRWCLLHPGCSQGGRGRMPNLRHDGEATVRCSCGETFTVDARALRALVESGKQVLAQDEAGELDRNAVPVIASIISRLSAIMPPSSAPLLALVRLHSQLLMPPTSSGLETAIAQITLAAEGAREAFPANHPTLGIILAERAKMLAVDRDELPDADSTNSQQVQLAGPRRPIVLDAARRTAKVAQLVAAVDALNQAATACRVGFGGGAVADEMRELQGVCERELDMLRR